ncbi:MAG: hypothetical protein PHU85_15435, partial [Phycisphaerae bacterium]|nr:hypothetical protein [Phycisphaerae bacterium]
MKQSPNVHEPEAPSTSGTPFDDERPAWADRLLMWPGPIAFGLTAAALAPLALTWTGRPWIGLVVLAGAALFWWTIMWVGRHVHAPHVLLVAPLLILLATALAHPLAGQPVDFFRHGVQVTSDPPAPQPAWTLDREAALVATEKLVILLLLAVPLYHAVWVG